MINPGNSYNHLREKNTSVDNELTMNKFDGTSPYEN
mgnify:CR=1 FL=1